MDIAKSKIRRAKGVPDRRGMLRVLRERIAAHKIAPGSRLGEQALCEEFGVSRAVVRDVLASLAESGLVHRFPNRGAVVARLDFDQAASLYAVREVLEGLAAREATLRMPPESWQDLVDLFDAPLSRDVERNDIEAYVAKLELLRRRTRDGAGNAVLAALMDNIQDRTAMLVRRIILLPGRAEVGMREHRAVLEAMRRGDADAAESAARANIRSGLEALRRFQPFVL